MRPDLMGREELLIRLNDACRLLERMEQLEKQIFSLQRGFGPTAHKKRLPGNVKAIFLGMVLFLAVLFGLAVLGDNIGEQGMSLSMILYAINLKRAGGNVPLAESMTRNGMRFIAGVIVFLAAAAGLLALFLFVRSNHRAVKKANERIDRSNAQGRVLEAANRQKAQELLVSLNTLILEGQRNVLSWLPQKYYSLKILRFLRGVIQDYRANTFQEAVNLYYQELDKREMRNELQQMALTQAQTLESLEALRNEIANLWYDYEDYYI